MAGNAGTTVLNIINEALGHLGVYTGDALDASDLQTAFSTFQFLLDGWAAEPLTFRQVVTFQFQTTAGKASYVVGPTGSDWVTGFAPQEFADGSLQQQYGTIELPIRVNTLREWEAIAIKSLPSGILLDCWPDYGTSNVTLNFWPVPNATLGVNLYLPQQVAVPTSTAATVSLAPGYAEALIFELAIKCSGKFGAAVPAWLPAAWAEAKSKIKAANFPILDARCDRALVSNHGGRFGANQIDFYTGK